MVATTTGGGALYLGELWDMVLLQESFDASVDVGGNVDVLQRREMRNSSRSSGSTVTGAVIDP